MEYIYIKYHRNRNVFIDSHLSGKTNETLRVEAGTHRIDLGEPQNYTPKFRRASVSGTTPLTPEEISFSYVGTAS